MPKDPLEESLVIEKIQRIVDTGYIKPNYAHWDIQFFAVPKGEDDVRIVYNGTKGGINLVVWAPPFFLPVSASLVRLIQIGTYQLDMDIGEMFLNFALHPSAWKYCGVNLKGFKGIKLPGKHDHMVWTTLWMGFAPSSANAVRHLSLAQEVAKGDPLDPSNPFRWDRVVMNMPASEEFDPSMPWIYKRNDRVGKIAGDCVTFVDDIRVTGYSVENCWQCGRRLSSVLQMLGIQDAARKRRPPSLEPGPWAGTIARSNSSTVFKTVTQDKWDKGKRYLADTKASMGTKERPQTVDRKILEQVRGFFNHLCITYDFMLPYLKGLHNSIDGWRDGRNIDGWRTEEGTWEDVLNHYVIEGKLSIEASEKLLMEKEDSITGPKVVMPVPRLFDDVEMLLHLMKCERPAQIPARYSRTVEVIYGFADASGRGLGSTVQMGSNENLVVRMGVWSTNEEAENSSNWKELRNLRESIMEEGERGNLKNSMVFMVTDNSTVEGAFYKGNTPSRALFEEIMKLKGCEIKYQFILYVMHCSGTRMISQGTDGVSRGVLNEGSLGGMPLRSFLPVNLNALERSQGLKVWINSWMPQGYHILTPEEWFVEGHDLRFVETGKFPRKMSYAAGTYLWIPPPAGGDVALEQLRFARAKRKESIHVFVIPRLFFALFRRQLYKEADLILFLPVGFECWPVEMHEPLILAFSFPYARHPPWRVQRTPKMLAVAREMRQMWKEKKLDGGNILRKLLLEMGKLPSMPEHVVRRVLYFERGV